MRKTYRSADLFLFVFLAFLGRSLAAEPGDPIRLRLKPDEVRPAINPYIYGQFIEHLGRCIYGGIWAEMLEDRKFYFPITPEYKPYTSLKDTPFPVVGASPWEILGTSEGVTMDKNQPFVGKHAPRVQPGSGIRQRDLGVLKGRKVTGYLWLAAEQGGARVDVSLSMGVENEPGETVTIEPAEGTFRKYEIGFMPGVDTDHASLSIRVTGAAVRIGTVSLMPADNVRGMRADTLALLKQLGATMYRWPGGNFVSGYDWRDGLGERDRRPPRKNPAWTGVEHNDFGLHEFIDFCREVKAEPVIAVNTGFGDHHSAAQQVEYCNGASSTPEGALRARHGHAEPFGVKYWCVGNEMWGPWQLGFMQLKHYTQKHNQAAEAMRAVDPSVVLIGSGQFGHRNPRHDPDEKRGWTEGMLEECASHMDLISEHFYEGNQKADTLAFVRRLARNIKDKAEGHRKLQTKLGLLPGHAIPIAMDEWNYWHSDAQYGELGCAYDLADAMGVAIGLHEYFRNTDIITMAHYAQTVNVIGCIKTTKTRAFLDATALPLMLYRHHFGSIPIAEEAEPGPSVTKVDISAAWSQDRKAITVAFVNPTREPRNAVIEIPGVNVASEATTWTITGPEPATRNTPTETPLQIHRESTAYEGSVALPPLSVRLIHLNVK
jgi:alpha-N-arabinofuranosidase